MPRLANSIVLLCALSLACFFAFVTPVRLSPRSCDTKMSSSPLAGTIRFVGKASASVSGDAIRTVEEDTSSDKTLYNFLTSDASNRVLLGTSNTKFISSASEGDDAIYECIQGGIGWFGLTVIPVLINRISRGRTPVVTISIEEARFDIKGGGLGNALASAMKRSETEIEGQTIVTWKEATSKSAYQIDGGLVLTLTIRLPRFLPLPPGFNAIGSKIVERTCRERLKQSLLDIKSAYIEWTEMPSPSTKHQQQAWGQPGNGWI